VTAMWISIDKGAAERQGSTRSMLGTVCIMQGATYTRHTRAAMRRTNQSGPHVWVLTPLRRHARTPSHPRVLTTPHGHVRLAVKRDVLSGAPGGAVNAKAKAPRHNNKVRGLAGMPVCPCAHHGRRRPLVFRDGEGC
jgi:hypothetical protein